MLVDRQRNLHVYINGVDQGIAAKHIPDKVGRLIFQASNAFNPLIHGLFSDSYFKVLWEGVTLNFLIFFSSQGHPQRKVLQDK